MLHMDHLSLEKGGRDVDSQCCHLSYEAEFTSDMSHIGGTDNVVADTHIWPPAATSGGVMAVTAAPTGPQLLRHCQNL